MFDPPLAAPGSPGREVHYLLQALHKGEKQICQIRIWKALSAWRKTFQVHYWLLGARTSVGFPQLFITIICHQFPGACSMHVTSAQPAGLLCSLLAGALSQATLNLLTSGSVGPARSRAQDSAVSRCAWGGHSPRAQHLPGLGFVPCSAWGGGGGAAGDGHVEKGSCWGHHCPAHGRSLCGVWQVSV